MGKCLKDIREATLKADLWGLLGDPRRERRHKRCEDTKLWFDRDSHTGKCLKDVREATLKADLGDPRRERRHKRREDKEHEQEKEQFGLRKGSYQTHWTISSASRHRQFEERD